MKALSIAFMILSIIGYSLVGTSQHVQEIKRLAPIDIQKRNWKILRYEGYQFGSWANNGGKVWYHVQNIDNPNIQYRVYVTLWFGELQYCYGSPEPLNRIEVNAAQ